ncbi:MAG: hypothetical protein KUG50_03225 [Cycloclasticus sp.]|nr:hypothetical protein [Cycloclasticus sp.]
MIVFIIASIDGLISTGPSKVYLKEAGGWVTSSNKNQSMSLFTNNQLVSYYAGSQKGKRIREPNFENVINRVRKGEVKENSIIAIQISRKKPGQKLELINALGTKPVKVFENSVGDSVLIFLNK